MTLPSRAKLASALLLLSLGLGAQAAATAVDDPLEVQLDAAFEAMLDAPADMDTILRYSRAATAAGDYESAIGALERLLLINDNMPVVKADLGLLYYRLESYPMALHHLTAAMEQADKLPADLRTTVKRTLARLDKRASRSTFSGTLSLGLRYQSNANAGPQSSTVLAANNLVPLPSDFREREDWDVNLYGRLRHEYDLRTQNGAAFDTVATLYATRHDKLDTLDTTMLEITPGIRFKPAPTQLKGLSLRPHLIGRIFQRDGDRYSDSVGAGIDARYRVREDLTFSGTYQYRRRNFDQSSKHPTLNQFDGHENALRLTVFKGLTRDTSLTVQGDAIDRATRRNFRDARELGLLAAVNMAYDPLFGSRPDPWLAHFSVSYRNADYDAPDPTVDPAHSREDDRWRIAIGSTAPITDDWSIRLGLSTTRVDSNIRNFDRDNTQFNVNAVGRF